MENKTTLGKCELDYNCYLQLEDIKPSNSEECNCKEEYSADRAEQWECDCYVDHDVSQAHYI